MKSDESRFLRKRRGAAGAQQLFRASKTFSPRQRDASGTLFRTTSSWSVLHWFSNPLHTAHPAPSPPLPYCWHTDGKMFPEKVLLGVWGGRREAEGTEHSQKVIWRTRCGWSCWVTDRIQVGWGTDRPSKCPRYAGAERESIGIWLAFLKGIRILRTACVPQLLHPWGDGSPRECEPASLLDMAGLAQ